MAKLKELTPGACFTIDGVTMVYNRPLYVYRKAEHGGLFGSNRIKCEKIIFDNVLTFLEYTYINADTDVNLLHLDENGEFIEYKTIDYEECKAEPEVDMVNHPSHYETGKFECIEVMREALGDAAVLDFCLCNAFKYIYRTNRKNGLEDIKKAKWYIDKYLEILDDTQALPATGSIE